MATRLSRPGQRCAQADVQAVAQTDGEPGLAGDVEAVGVVVAARIPVGRPGDQEHRLVLGDGHPVPGGVDRGIAALVLGGGPVAEDLLHGVSNDGGVVEHLGPLVGVAAEQHHGVAHQLGDRLRSRRGQQGAEAGDLGIVEVGCLAVLGLHLGLDQGGQHVVGRLGPLLLGQLEQVHALGHAPLLGGLAAHGRALLAVEHGVGPQPDLLAVFGGHAQDGGDDLDGKRGGELLEDVELAPAHERVEIAADDVAHQGLVVADGAGGERSGHQLAITSVLGRVHGDDRAQLGGLVRGQLLVGLAVSGGEGLEVAVGGHHVVEAAQGVEVVLLAVIAGGVFPQVGVGVVGIVEEVPAERIELNGLGVHAPSIDYWLPVSNRAVPMASAASSVGPCQAMAPWSNNTARSHRARAWPMCCSTINSEVPASRMRASTA